MIKRRYDPEPQNATINVVNEAINKLMGNASWNKGMILDVLNRAQFVTREEMKDIILTTGRFHAFISIINHLLTNDDQHLDRISELEKWKEEAMKLMKDKSWKCSCRKLSPVNCFNCDAIQKLIKQ